MNIQHVIDAIDLKFTSNNSVPVERATLTLQEWLLLREIIASLGRVATGQCEQAVIE